jgi:hypothetical protein
LEKWTDKVMLPALRGVLSSDRLQYLTPADGLLVLNSQAERIALGRDVGDNAYEYFVPGDSLQQIWDEFVTTTRQPQLAEFRDMFLVEVGVLEPLKTAADTFEKVLARTVQLWEGCLDMQYAPKGDMEICIETKMRL